MNRSSLRISLSFLFILLIQTSLFSQDKIYVRSTIGPPWNQNNNEDAMDSIFGVGNWQDLRFETLNVGTLLSSASCFIFLEGSDDNDQALFDFLAVNMTAIENWVSSGGSLFLNAAGQGAPNSTPFGFGGVVNNYQPASSNVAIAPGASGHAIFAGPSTPVGTSWTGTSFSHNVIVGGGTTSLITDAGDTSRVVACEKAWGSGRVIFGGMTVTNYHSPQPEATNLRENIIAYLGTCNPVAINAGISQISSPLSGCGSSVFEDVTVTITNYGTDTITSLNVSYTLDGGAPITESVTTTILPGGNYVYTFAAQAFLPTWGVYSFDSWTILAGDTVYNDDTLANYLVLRDSAVAQTVCIYDNAGGNCGAFGTDLCSAGNDYGDTSLQSSAPIYMSISSIDSIVYQLYYTDCDANGTTVMSFYLNGMSIGTFTPPAQASCSCTPAFGTYPYTFTITDTGLLNAAWNDTSILSVQHNGIDMAISGYVAEIYSQCPLLTAVMTNSDTSICLGNTATLDVTVFNPSSFPPPYTYSWSPSAGLSCTTCQSPNASPTTTTTYWVVVTDSIGSLDSGFVTVTVDPVIAVANAGADTTMCEGDAVTLNGSGTGTYLWSPGTGLSSTTIVAPVASPTSTTTYTLTATNACGSVSDAMTLTVNPQPIVAINADVVACPSENVQLVSGGGVTYSWSPTSGLDDAFIASPLANPGVTTTYTVTVTSAAGCTAMDSTTISILDVTASSSTAFMCTGGTAQLDATSNLAGTTYIWSPSTALSCTSCATTNANPTSTIMYYVSGTLGSCTVTDSILLTVEPAPASPCSPITFGYCCGMGIYNVTLGSIDNTTPDGVESYQNYACTDATTLTEDLSYLISVQTGTGFMEHVRVWIDLNNNGSFETGTETVMADCVLTFHSDTVTILQGTAVLNTPLRMRVASEYFNNASPQPCTDVEYGQFEDYTVIIVPNTIPPTASFTVFEWNECEGTFGYSDQSANNPTSWFWDFGDGTTSTLQNYTHSFATADTFTVTLTVTNPFGSDTYTMQVISSTFTAQNITVSDDTVATGTSITFTDNSIGATTWAWDFGDTFSASTKNTFHSYANPGLYTVTLIVTNGGICSSTKTIQILVIDCSNAPVTSPIVGPTLVNIAGTSNYSVTLNPGSTYSWTVVGGVQVGGGVNFISVIWTGGGIGEITVIETDSMGCDGAPVTITVSISTGIDQSGYSGESLKVYPNPNTGTFALAMNFQNNTGLVIQLFDFTGATVYEKEMDDVVNHIVQNVDLSGYARGVYFVQITTDTGVLTEKVVLY